MSGAGSTYGKMRNKFKILDGNREKKLQFWRESCASYVAQWFSTGVPRKFAKRAPRF